MFQVSLYFRLMDISSLAYSSCTLATGVLTVSTNASFGIGVCGFRRRTLVQKQEWTLNCTTKVPPFCLPLPYSCHWSLNNVHQRHLRPWRVRIPWTKFASETRKNLKVHNPHEIPRNRFNWHYIINQVSPRMLPW